ncbi:MAG: TetR/AcrR family transcriptional regulator [Solobacterium sp.]|nr:TetR/AcrR family transcriptional regulator [Solobacterium sp.]
MNPKFYNLPIEKQQAVINAGFHVFSQNSYKKSPMSEIAETAGISKSLLFHYFTNKKELYLFLWDTSARITVEEMEKNGCYEQADLFDSMEKGMQVKLELMRKYPDIGMFSIRAFYEKDPEVRDEVHKIMNHYLQIHAAAKLAALDPDDFLPGIDLDLMYREMYLASEGYLWEKMQSGNIDVTEMEQDFRKLIDFWKAIYMRKPKGADEK